MTKLNLLPGVSADYVLDRLVKAGGNEIESGKFDSPHSSAALAVNCFAWFAERPELLPHFPLVKAEWPPTSVDIEYQARFPWSGGRHPWLDAVAVTKRELIGIESKRFEPFRDSKTASFSEAYSRDEWGSSMGPYQQMRDQLISGALKFDYLDAGQLVKHAFGIRTQAAKEGKRPILVYLYSEPRMLNGQAITDVSHQSHRNEVTLFSVQVQDAEVEFHSLSYREWIASWSALPRTVVDHGQALLKIFLP